MRTVITATLTIALIISLIANVLIYERYSSSRAVVRLGDQVITRKQYQDQLDFEDGKQVLNMLLYRRLIESAAKKAGVMPTNADLDARIAQIDRTDPSSLASVRNDIVRYTELCQAMTTGLAMDNLRMQSVSLSDADIAEYYARHKAEFALPMQIKTTIVVASNDLDAETAQSLLQQGMSPSLIARQPRLRVSGQNGFALASPLPPAISKQLTATVRVMKQGETKIITIGHDYLIIKIDVRKEAGVPPLEQLKPLVTRTAKLRKAVSPEVILTRLYKAANPQFEMDRYAPYFSDMDARVKQMDAGPGVGRRVTKSQY